MYVRKECVVVPDVIDMKTTYLALERPLNRKPEAVKIYIYLCFWAAERHTVMEERKTDGPADVTSVSGKFGTYQSDVVNNNKAPSFH